MRVLMISLDRGLLAPGSSGDVVARHQEYAARAGHLDVVVLADSSYEDKILSNNLHIFSSKSSKIFHFKKAFKKAEELVKKNKYDLIITQEFAAPVGAKLKQKHNIPWLITIHSMFFSSEWLKGNPLAWFLLWKVKKSSKLADGFRVTNHAIEEKLREWGFKQPVLVQSTPVNIKEFLVEEKIQNGVLRILFVGRLSPEKNIELLIQACKKLSKSYELLIVGEGPQDDYLRSLAYGLDNIKFLGPKFHQELANIYKTSDIFVLPSNTESFGKVLIEAGAAGCALIATKTAGAKSILKDRENGLLVEVGDLEGLIGTLNEVMNDLSLWQKLSLGAREMVKNYDAQIAREKIVSFWQQIAKLQ